MLTATVTATWGDVRALQHPPAAAAPEQTSPDKNDPFPLRPPRLRDDEPPEASHQPRRGNSRGDPLSGSAPQWVPGIVATTLRAEATSRPPTESDTPRPPNVPASRPRLPGCPSQLYRYICGHPKYLTSVLTSTGTHNYNLQHATEWHQHPRWWHHSVARDLSSYAPNRRPYSKRNR